MHHNIATKCLETFCGPASEEKPHSSTADRMVGLAADVQQGMVGEKEGVMEGGREGERKNTFNSSLVETGDKHFALFCWSVRL